ncbi:conjugal transfer protein [Robbsia sp. Bb-Pol-6]|uniref:Conjugal transfer protein n=1 Tax=Robbsia betulipollinis TaxID=2981849 RepID=A0ABT3ZJP4_9BURK|nr:conjugal transfer protein [Robbsia betulipollinis]MCY0386744.1 conjugal transfer protein [Robbsia betulipollinis]
MTDNVLKLGLLIAAAASAWVPESQAKDACATVLCMAGMLQGQGKADGCDGAIADYFNIVSYRHGHIDFNAMGRKRLDFLNECSANDGWARKINDRFGSTVL